MTGRPTGLSVEIPADAEGELKPLSSFRTKSEEVGYQPWVVTVALRMPCFSLLFFLGLAGICSFWSVSFFDLSEPLAGLRLVYDETAEEADSWVMATQESQDFWANQNGNQADVKVRQQTQRRRCLDYLYISHGPVQNVFTPQGIATMRQIEQSIVGVPGYENFCLRDEETANCVLYESVFNYLNVSNLETQEAIDQELGELWDERRGPLKYFQSEFDGFENPKSNMTIGRVCFGLPLEGYRNQADRGAEQEGKLEKFILENYQDMMDAYHDDGNPLPGDIKIYYRQKWLDDARTKDTLNEDVMKCIFAIGMVWLVMLLHMRSLFLASLALLQVLLSFPMAFFVYRIVLGIELFGGLQAVAIFIVLGVGADDCFIYVDAFKETLKLTKIEGWGLPERLSFAYKRAQFTMLVTTCTTGFAFMMLAISRIPTVRYFGIFASLLIIGNFLLVMSLYTCVLVLWDRYIRRIRFKHCLRAAGVSKKKKQQHDISLAPATVLETPQSKMSATGSFGEGEDSDFDNLSTGLQESSPRDSPKARNDFVVPLSSSKEEEGEGILFAAKRSMQNLWDAFFEYEEDIIDTTLDADDARSVMTGAHSSFRDPSTPRSTRSAQSNGSDGAPPSPFARPAASQSEGKQDAEDEFAGFTWWARVLAKRRARIAVLSLFAMIALTSVALTSQLEIANEENPFWPEGHFFWWWDNSVPLKFHNAKSRPRKYFQLVHGLKEPFANRTGTKETIKEDFGAPIYDTKFNLAAPAAQKRVAEECRYFFETDRELYVNGNTAFCFMVTFQLWREARQAEFPVPGTESVAPVLAGVPHYPEEAAQSGEPFEQELLEFLSRAQFEGFKNAINIDRIAGANASRPKVKFCQSQIATTLSFDDPFLKRSEVASAYEAFEEEVLQKDLPAELGAPESAFVTEWDYFVTWKTQWLFLFNSFTSLGLSILITLGFLFIATNNIRIAALAGITISGISFTVLGFVVIVGWKLDTIISVAITLLVGFIADYCVHLAVAYDEAFRECGIQGRVAKVNHVVKTMSISIAAGATSTFGASTMLFPTTVRFFAQFGGFLSVAVATAVVWSLVFFPALMASFGPEGNDGTGVRCLQSKRTIGLYDLEFHKVRSTTGSRLALFITLLLYAGLAGGAVVGYGVRTGNFGFELEIEEIEFVPSPFEVYPTREGDAPGSSMPSIADMSADMWYKLSPAGETGCARGAPFSFFFKRAAEAQAPLVVEFQGGAPCWNKETCAADKKVIIDSVDLVEGKLGRVIRGEEQLEGYTDPAGPLAGAHVLYIPQCTGDYFWGNRTHAYTEETVIEHRGSLNAIAVLRWILPEMASHLDAKSVFFTGTDTGSYASILYANVMAAWLELTAQTDTAFVQHGDGGLGVFAPGFFEEAIEAWGAQLSTQELEFIIGNQTVLVPLSLLRPEGLEELFNLTSTLNFTALNECIQDRQDNATAEEPLTNEQLSGLLLAGDRDQLLEACANETGGALPPSLEELFPGGTIDVDDIWADLGADDPFNFTNGGNLTGGDGVVSGGNNATQGGAVNVTDLLEQQCEEQLRQGIEQSAFCLNTTELNSLNGTGLLGQLTPEDMEQLRENAQIIPSMYVLSALRYRRYIFSQFSTAYDYEATRQVAMQYIGQPLPGVTFEEQKIFYGAVTAVYDAFLKSGFRLPNYRHFFVASDYHGHLDKDRHFRVLDNSLYQIFYAWLNGISTEGLPTSYDCRDDGPDACLLGVDNRTSVQYFYDDLNI